MEVKGTTDSYSLKKVASCPPGYKRTEVGVIPKDWILQDVGSFATTVASGRSHVNSEFGDYPVYGSTGIIGRSTHSDYSGRAVLIARVGANAGKLSVVDGEYGVTDNTIMVRIVSSVDLDYFWRQLEARRLNSMVFGSGQPLLTGTQIKSLAIPFPPTKAEQEAIAEALGDAGEGPDDAGIEHRLLGFGGEWEVKTLGDLFDFSGGFTASREQLSSEGHCYLHYGDIHGSRKSFINVGSEYEDIPKLMISLHTVSRHSMLEDGDVVFVDASEDDEGTSRHVVIMNPDGIPFISGLHTIVAKSKTNALQHEFRRYCFQSAAVKAQFHFFAVGTKVSGISKTNIGRVALQIPPPLEQAAIATILSDIDAEIAVQEEKLFKARSLKKGMMQELLTGRIRLV